MKAEFQNTVSILVKAFLEGTLECTNCSACACGNLVAAANGYTIKRHRWLTPNGEIIELSFWQDVVWAIRDKWYAEGIEDKQAQEKGLAEIAATGYTAQDFVLIESAFMDACQVSANNGADRAAENFAGLMAVVDVLADIHGIDLATAEASKLLFVKA